MSEKRGKDYIGRAKYHEYVIDAPEEIANAIHQKANILARAVTFGSTIDSYQRGINQVEKILIEVAKEFGVSISVTGRKKRYIYQRHLDQTNNKKDGVLSTH